MDLVHMLAKQAQAVKTAKGKCQVTHICTGEMFATRGPHIDKHGCKVIVNCLIGKHVGASTIEYGRRKHVSNKPAEECLRRRWT